MLKTSLILPSFVLRLLAFSPASLAAAMLFLSTSSSHTVSYQETTEDVTSRRRGHANDIPINVVEDVHDDDGRHQPQVNLALQLELELVVWKQARNNAVDMVNRDKDAHNARVAALNRQMNSLDIVKVRLM